MSTDTAVTLWLSIITAASVLFLAYLRWERWRKRHDIKKSGD